MEKDCNFTYLPNLNNLFWAQNQLQNILAPNLVIESLKWDLYSSIFMFIYPKPPKSKKVGDCQVYPTKIQPED